MSKTIKLNIPSDLAGWRAIRERALTIYWGRRKDGATENEALCSVLDDCLRDDAALPPRHEILTDGPPCPTCGFAIKKRERRALVIDED